MTAAAVADQKRTAAGQFAPGHSGNPAGRPKGARNRMTIAAEALLEENGEGLVRKLIDDSLGGDRQALRFLVGRLCPAGRDEPITLDLPPGKEGNLVYIHALLMRAIADGDITPKEALVVARVLVAGAKLIQLQRKLGKEAGGEAVRSRTRGPAAGREQTDPARAEPNRTGPDARPTAGTGPAAPVSGLYSGAKGDALTRRVEAAEREAAPVTRQYFPSRPENPPVLGVPCGARAALRASTTLARPLPDLNFARAA